MCTVINNRLLDIQDGNNTSFSYTRFCFAFVQPGKVEPFVQASSWLAGALHLKGKPVYLPAKRFAARIGLLFSALILAFHIACISIAIPLSIVLAFFAALESFIGFCAGCYVYNLFKRVVN